MFYVDDAVCTLLCELDAYKLVIACCMHYVKANNKGIVIQALGIISGTLAVSKLEKMNSS